MSVAMDFTGCTAFCQQHECPARLLSSGDTFQAVQHCLYLGECQLVFVYSRPALGRIRYNATGCVQSNMYHAQWTPWQLWEAIEELAAPT